MSKQNHWSLLIRLSFCVSLRLVGKACRLKLVTSRSTSSALALRPRDSSALLRFLFLKFFARPVKQLLPLITSNGLLPEGEVIQLKFLLLQSRFTSPDLSCTPPCRLIGHVPMLLDPEFSDMVQAIGKASLGATDAEFLQLTRLFW
jgi:hypothetical protein